MFWVKFAIIRWVVGGEEVTGVAMGRHQLLSLLTFLLLTEELDQFHQLVVLNVLLLEIQECFGKFLKELPSRLLNFDLVILEDY